jgi:hypothetical protein
MEKIIIPIELQLTPHSQAVMDAFYKAIPQQFKSEDISPSTGITLRDGEHYAGVLIDEFGNHLHHLALIGERPKSDVTWDDAIAWAKSIGGELPTRQEQSLLFANCKRHLKAEWHWSSEAHEKDASCAWYCYFYDGRQYNFHKSYAGSAVAVRRF